jgi:4-hydroxy-2-oxoglutarate aldolase
MGAVGGILAVANVIPQEYVRIQSLFDKGKMNEAKALQNQLTPLAKAVTTRYGIGGLKIAMDLAGYFGGHPRLPLKRPNKEVEEELRRLLLRLKEV